MPGSGSWYAASVDDARIADESFGIAKPRASDRRRRMEDGDDRSTDALHTVRIAEAETGGLDRGEHEVLRRGEHHLHQRQAAEKARRTARFADELRRRSQGAGHQRIDSQLPHETRRAQLGEPGHADQPVAFHRRQGRQFAGVGGAEGRGRKKHSENADDRQILLHYFIPLFLGATAPRFCQNDNRNIAICQ